MKIIPKYASKLAFFYCWVNTYPCRSPAVPTDPVWYTRFPINSPAMNGYDMVDVFFRFFFINPSSILFECFCGSNTTPDALKNYWLTYSSDFEGFLGDQLPVRSKHLADSKFQHSYGSKELLLNCFLIRDIENIRYWTVVINFCLHFLDSGKSTVIFHFKFGIVADGKAWSRPAGTTFIVRWTNCKITIIRLAVHLFSLFATKIKLR